MAKAEDSAQHSATQLGTTNSALHNTTQDSAMEGGGGWKAALAQALDLSLLQALRTGGDGTGWEVARVSKAQVPLLPTNKN